MSGLATRERTIRVRLPTAVLESAAQHGSIEPDRPARPLRGCRVGLRTEGQWASWLFIIEQWAQKLAADGAMPDVIVTDPYRLGEGLTEERRKVSDWAARIDVGISGLGTCGSCTSYTVTDGIQIAKAGKPGAVAITEAFVPHAESIAGFLGHPELQVLVLPHPLEGLEPDRLSDIAEEAYPRFLALVGVTR